MVNFLIGVISTIAVCGLWVVCTGLDRAGRLPYLYYVQKRLREDYGIDITIYRSFSMTHSYHYEIVIDCDYDSSIVQECVPNRPYELALESAVIKGLNIARTRVKTKKEDEAIRNLCKNC